MPGIRCYVSRQILAEFRPTILSCLVNRRSALGSVTRSSFPGSKLFPRSSEPSSSSMADWSFVRGAWGELADRKPGIDALISLAIVVVFGTSLVATFGLFEIDVWWELASLITIMVLGHWLEMRAISRLAVRSCARPPLLPTPRNA